MNNSKASKPLLYISLAVIMLVGVIGALRMAMSAPTYDGSTTDVTALYNDPSTYETTGADGIANIIVKENNEKTAALNTVYSVTYNFRGYDTLGESFILIGAIAGTTAILRKKGNKASEAIVGTKQNTEKKEPLNIVDYRSEAAKKAAAPKFRKKSVIMKTGADALLPLAIVYGWYIVLHGAMSPGGGFQGGVIAAGAVLLIYLAYGITGIRKAFNAHFLHSTETISEIFYVCVGIAGLLAGLHFCFNFVFPFGREESAMLMNDAVGYHVMAGICCLLIMMLEALSVDSGSGEETEIAAKAASVKKAADMSAALKEADV